MRKAIITTLALLVVLPIAAQSIYPGVAVEKQKVKNTAAMKAESFSLSDVRLLPSRFLDNQKRDSAWIVSIPAKSIAHSFETTAGVFSSREGGYMTVKKMGGWESLDCDLRGHTAGHLLSACAYMYASTGQSVFKAKADSIISMIYGAQKALGTGYVSGFPEELINRNIRGESVWAPWYTLHKVLSGLIDNYVYCSNEQALEVAMSFASWAYNKLRDIDEPTRQRMIRNEFGGINEAFYNLYTLTESKECLFLAQFFYHNEVIDPVKGHNSDFGTKHTNTFIPKIIAEARHYELTSDATSRDVAEFFFHEMTEHHTFATGELSDKEHFFNPQEQSKHLSAYTGEACCTYNMLKLARHLFCWNADIKTADYYERALYNHILGQQDTSTGMVCYFLPLQSGAYKLYSTPWNSFWCCVGSAFESNAKYGEAIYYHNSEGLYVNLFIPSILDWRDKGMTVKQETRFPESSQITFTIGCKQATKTAIRLRYPTWATSAKLTINGKKQAVKNSHGSYITIERTWHDGDVVTLQLGMEITLQPTTDNDSIAAVMYGPIVLAGEKGTEDMTMPVPQSDPTQYNDYYTFDYKVPSDLKTTLCIDRNRPSKSLHRIGDTLKFTSSDGETLLPFYDIHRQRYVVYWNLKD